MIILFVSFIRNNNYPSQALICTGNKSIENALDWIGELGAEEMEAFCNKSDDGE